MDTLGSVLIKIFKSEKINFKCLHANNLNERLEFYLQKFDNKC